MAHSIIGRFWDSVITESILLATPSNIPTELPKLQILQNTPSNTLDTKIRVYTRRIPITNIEAMIVEQRCAESVPAAPWKFNLTTAPGKLHVKES